MKQGRIRFMALALAACTLATGAILARDAQAAPRKAAPAASGASSRAGTRQFSGWVTAFDAGSLTVEKRGKQPRTMVFSKDADTRTTGDVQKEVRVTVYYRDADGKPTASRVIVKPRSPRASRGSGNTSSNSSTGSSGSKASRRGGS